MVQIWRRSKKCHQKTIIGDNNAAPQLKDLMGRDIFENKKCFHTFFPIGFKFHSALCGHIEGYFTFQTLTITIDIDIGIDIGIHSQKSLPFAIVAAFI